MIRRVKARNFLSLMDVDLELGRRNVLVGPNMSGKSNLIDLFKFLTTMATERPGLQAAVLQRGGFSELVWKGGEERQVSLAITIELPRAENQPKPQTDEYALTLMGGPGGSCTVESEKLTVHVDGNEPRTIYEIGHGRQGVVEEQGQLRPINLSNWSTALESVGLPNVEADQFRSIVAGWRFYQIIPALMRQENAPNPEPFLKQHGENFSSWITTLQTHPEESRQIRQAVCDAFPDLAEIIIQPTQASRIVLSTHEKYLRRATPIYRMSDGELAFLALVSLIFAPLELGASLYCIEEPENYLHPYLLETLVELLTQRQAELGEQSAQIIATTHSPYLVDKISVDDLIVTEKLSGETRFRSPSSSQHLKELLARAELGLGELWYSGALGGA